VEERVDFIAYYQIKGTLLVVVVIKIIIIIAVVVVVLEYVVTEW